LSRSSSQGAEDVWRRGVDQVPIVDAIGIVQDQFDDRLLLVLAAALELVDQDEQRGQALFVPATGQQFAHLGQPERAPVPAGDLALGGYRHAQERIALTVASRVVWK
jgi:hypothetical protein